MGSILQLLASIRDPHVAEPFWDGASWETRTQHAGNVTLSRWLQKNPINGKRQEVILERVLCDCLDEELPCWVLSERSPDIEGLQEFAGAYGPFRIPAVPKGYDRTRMAES